MMTLDLPRSPRYKRSYKLPFENFRFLKLGSKGSWNSSKGLRGAVGEGGGRPLSRAAPLLLFSGVFVVNFYLTRGHSA